MASTNDESCVKCKGLKVNCVQCESSLNIGTQKSGKIGKQKSEVERAHSKNYWKSEKLLHSLSTRVFEIHFAPVAKIQIEIFVGITENLQTGVDKKLLFLIKISMYLHHGGGARSYTMRQTRNNQALKHIALLIFFHIPIYRNLHAYYIKLGLCLTTSLLSPCYFVYSRNKKRFILRFPE